MRLNLGLVARRLERAAETGDDDVEFRAVLLHEFAHIRYGDVTAARITMAVWGGRFSSLSYCLTW